MHTDESFLYSCQTFCSIIVTQHLVKTEHAVFFSFSQYLALISDLTFYAGIKKVTNYSIECTESEISFAHNFCFCRQICNETTRWVEKNFELKFPSTRL
jgi:hypothetical protein